MKRILYIAAWAAAALIVLLYLGLPAGFGLFAVLPGQTEVGDPPEGFEAVTLHTKDGVALQGWYHPPQNGAVIVLLHGAGGSRADTRPYAQMLVGNGYGALLFDQRGHGTS
ncbi:MAG TPA: hypothetical protein VLS48_04080, partial [Anaerolineales bacterium]|nr:hypothetical protein [Anaerolineales bacterium]